jgi:uncharacterized protein
MVMPKERALIEVRIAGLAPGVHEFDFSCKAEDFSDPVLTDIGFSKEISVTVVVEKNEGELAVDIATDATAEFSCDLCLAAVTRELKGSYRAYYVFDQTGERADIGYEDYRVIDRNSTSIGLTEDVRETILLSVPMKVTCTGNPDCRVYRKENNGDSGADGDSEWLESLEKLKKKFR